MQTRQPPAQAVEGYTSENVTWPSQCAGQDQCLSTPDPCSASGTFHVPDGVGEGLWVLMLGLMHPGAPAALRTSLDTREGIEVGSVLYPERF